MIYAMRDLRYLLIEGEAGWMENFRILEVRRNVWNGSCFVVYALATSHAVSVELQDQKFTELLSCRGELNLRPSLAEMSAHRPFELATRLQGVHYRFQLSLLAPGEDDALQGAFDPDHLITVTYPRIPGLDTPVTKIGWKIEPAALRIETLHTYPEEAGGVRSRSIFESS
jgi:hypothetical protein